MTRIEKLAAAGPDAVILREKDLSNAEYAGLAVSVSEICQKYNIPCILHGSAGAAAASDGTTVHFPAGKLRSLTREEKNRFSSIGVSCHSAAEAEEAVIDVHVVVSGIVQPRGHEQVGLLHDRGIRYVYHEGIP